MDARIEKPRGAATPSENNSTAGPLEHASSMLVGSGQGKLGNRGGKGLIHRSGCAYAGYILLTTFLVVGTGCWGPQSDEAVIKAKQAHALWVVLESAKCNIYPVGSPESALCLSKVAKGSAEQQAKIKELEKGEKNCLVEIFKSSLEFLVKIFKAIAEAFGLNTTAPIDKDDEVKFDMRAQSTNGFHYEFEPGGTMAVNFDDGTTEKAEIIGFFDVTLEPSGDGLSGDLVGGEFTAFTSVGEVRVTLTSATASTVTLDPPLDDVGQWVGEMKLIVDVDSDLLGYPVWVVTLPVYADDPLGELNMTTHGKTLPGTDVMPTFASEADPAADCNRNGLPDGSEIETGLVADCNINGRPDECEIADQSSADCNENGVPDACDSVFGDSCDSNANGILEPDCEWVDCNANGLSDCEDLRTSDLDYDGVMDACEVDCNGNGQHDAYDIIDGLSLDENSDGIPDECATPKGCEGDANGDSLIDPLDVGYIQARFGCEENGIDAECLAADQNGDGLVDPLDVGFIQARFGDECKLGAISCSQSCSDGSSCSVTCGAGEQAFCYCADFGNGPASCSCSP